MSFVREANAEPLSGYRLIEPLGNGGFGEVWKCEAPGGLFKAIKFVYGNLNALDFASARAEQEFNALNRIKEVRHPFVLSMDRIEVVEGELVIVMELADKSLYDVFVECQAAGLVGIPRDALLRYLRDAAEALDHMNEKHGLQHLDIKPQNLFLVSDRVKIADFGLVKDLSRQNGSIGGVTPLYAAPETFQGKITEHSDQYSLAVVYQEMLTGQRPFNAKSARLLAIQHTQGEPELRALPEAERPIVARALSKEASKRFPNCLSLVRALYTARNLPPAGPLTLGKDGVQAEGERSQAAAQGAEDILLQEEMTPHGLGEAAPPATSGADSLEEVSNLGITRHLPDTGVLRPTLIIGVGDFGRRALLDLRCRFLDRFGDLGKIPLQHFLYVDADPDAVRAAVRGAPEVAYSVNEVYHLPLQPMGHYRRRMLDQITEWLPREKLYAMPRSLQPQGSRALGRLAFVDNHLRLVTRLRRELEQITHADALYQSVSQTGLALRDNRPRIYVIAAAGGGASGLLVDLGYALRQLLQRLHMAEGDVTALLFCGAPDDPATPRCEQANVYATLTELNHFTDSCVPFTAQYGADGPRTVNDGAPFDRVYLLKLAHRSSEALGEAVAHLGSYLFHELTTPLGLRLERSRQLLPSDDATTFRSFGTYGVWFPRGLLLRLAAQRACVHLLRDWQEAGEAAQPEVEAACARVLAEPGLRFEALSARIEAEAAADFEGDLGVVLAALLSKLEEQAQQSFAPTDPGNWACQAFERIKECVGGGSRALQDSDWRKSKLGRALTAGVQRVAKQWEARLATAAFELMDRPGQRVAAAEAALTRFMQFCDESRWAEQARLDQQTQKTQHAAQQLENALKSCMSSGSGFSFFGGRARRALRLFMDHLAAFSRQRLAEEVAASGLLFFAMLKGGLEERQRELSFCRQRLRHLQEGLEAPPTADPEDGAGSLSDVDLASTYSHLPSTESYWEAMRRSGTVRLVLPDGESDLEQAAYRFVEKLNPEQWQQLEQALQDRVLGPAGGVHQVCVSNGDLVRSLALQLIPQAAACLSELLPITDVAQAEFSAAACRGVEVASACEAYYASAAPLLTAKEPNQQHGFLLLPASDSGTAFGEEARKVLPDAEALRVPGQADLMFCREQGHLTVHDLQQELRACRAAYEELANSPVTSPHARFDLTDWVPLDP